MTYVIITANDSDATGAMNLYSGSTLVYTPPDENYLIWIWTDPDSIGLQALFGNADDGILPAIPSLGIVSAPIS